MPFAIVKNNDGLGYHIINLRNHGLVFAKPLHIKHAVDSLDVLHDTEMKGGSLFDVIGYLYKLFFPKTSQDIQDIMTPASRRPVRR